MISVEYDRGSAIVDGDTVVGLPEQARIEKLLTRPAKLLVGSEFDGGDEETFVEVAPGEPGFVRAALLSLPGARVLIDTEA